eukprot:SAG31_NODE_18618_length_629_cov_1.060377_1_plen_149_part_01
MLKSEFSKAAGWNKTLASAKVETIHKGRRDVLPVIIDDVMKAYCVGGIALLATEPEPEPEPISEPESEPELMTELETELEPQPELSKQQEKRQRQKAGKLAVACASAVAAGQLPDEQAYQRGLKHWENSRYSEAIADFRLAQGILPKPN